MRAPRITSVAHKKPDAELLKKRKADTNTKSDKSSKKNKSDAPKRPATAFFVFMEDFRKSFKESFPDQKSGPAVAKAGGEKWKSMSDAEKAPYAEKTLKRKGEYEIALQAYKMKLNGCGGNEDPGEESEKSTSEVNDGAEQEASS